MSDRDLIIVGETGLLFRDPSNLAVPARRTRQADDAAPTIGGAQRRVLVALCRPLATVPGPARFPATNQVIAEELNLTISAVKANLTQLYEKLGLDHLAQNEKRLALAETALRSGMVQPSELERPATD